MLTRQHCPPVISLPPDFHLQLAASLYGSEIALLRASRQTPIDAVKQLMLANGFANKGN